MAEDRWVRIETPEGAEYDVLESNLAAHPQAKRLGYVGPFGNLEPMPAPHARPAAASGEKPA